jgi:ribosome-binding ATPase YchF (GTP1/OBG family)
MSEEFLDIHKEAKELVFGLKKLNQEVQNYKTSKEQLQDFTQTLAKFIEETKKLTEKSAKIIENTSDLTPEKIEKKVDELKKRIDKIDDQMILLIKVVESNTEAIKNKKFTLFGGKN